MEFSPQIRQWSGRMTAFVVMAAGAGMVPAMGSGLPPLKKSYEDEVARAVLPLREKYHKALLSLEQALAGKGDYEGARMVQKERMEMEKLVPGAGGGQPAKGLAPGAAAATVILGAEGESGGGAALSSGSWTGWEKAGSFVRWRLPAGIRSGGYLVEMLYAADKEGQMGFTVRENFHTLNRTLSLPAAPAGKSPEGRLHLGLLRIRPGASELELRVTAPAASPGLRIIQVHLIPQEAGS